MDYLFDEFRLFHWRKSLDGARSFFRSRGGSSPVKSPELPEPHTESVTARGFHAGARFAANWAPRPDRRSVPALEGDPSNPLWEYFVANTAGPGIWKWTHYFDAYHRHFQQFVGMPVNVVEIGVFSGGSLPMWRKYFGPDSRIVGIDVEEACRRYEEDGISVVIGDQGSRAFWRLFRQQHPQVDIVIDDGGHTPEQQRITLEEMLPHLQPGGVYVCEDIHRTDNEFGAFAAGLTSELNERVIKDDGVQRSSPSPFQREVYAIHFYPYMLVIEKYAASPDQLLGLRHGTEWQPFL